MDSLRVGSGCTPSAWQCPTHLKAQIRGQLEGLPARPLPLGCHGDPCMELMAFLVRGRGVFQSVQARIDSGTVSCVSRKLRAQPLAEGWI